MAGSGIPSEPASALSGHADPEGNPVSTAVQRNPGFYVSLMVCWAVLLLPPTPAVCAAEPSSATALASVAPGEPQTVSVSIPTVGRRGGSVRYTVDPAPDVSINGARNGSLSWDPTKSRDLSLELQVTVPRRAPQGPMLVARVTLRWPDGTDQTLDVRVNVLPLPAGVSARDMEAEVIPVPRAAAPGGVVKLMYAIFSYEDTDERVRLRVDAGPGWRLLDAEAAERDIFVEAWEVVEGELYLQVPEDATIGDRQLVRLFAEVVGEPGEIEGRNFVSVVKRGGAKPGVPTITGTSAFGLSQLGADASRRSGGLELSSRFGKTSTFSFSYDHGLQNTLSNYRYEEARTRVSGTLRHAGWDVSFGNYVSAQGNALNGPYVRGRGASVRRPTGRLVTELVVAQPNTIGGLAGGHVVRGRAGVRTSKLLFALSASDFGRPSGGYTTLSPVTTTVLDPETEEQLEFERRLTATSSSNRVQGAGVDAEFQPARTHRFVVRAGSLWLSNAGGARTDGATGEASYALNTRPVTLNLRWRDTPPTVPGISIPGDERGADGSLRLVGDLRLVGRAYRSTTETVGSDLFSRGEGAAAGLRFTRGARRIEVRGNYRQSQYSLTNVRRTVSLNAATPLGPLTLTGTADVGEQNTGLHPGANGTPRFRIDRVAFYQTGLRWWSKETGTLSLNASHSEAGGVSRQRLDLMTALKFGEFELAGGAWATRGYTVGGRPGAWTAIGLPVGFDSLLTLGIDYTPLTWAGEPSLRGTVNIRKRFSIPVPFVRPAAVPGIGTTAEHIDPALAQEVTTVNR
jgi:hypothetical protein